MKVLVEVQHPADLVEIPVPITLHDAKQLVMNHPQTAVLKQADICSRFRAEPRWSGAVASVSKGFSMKGADAAARVFGGGSFVVVKGETTSAAVWLVDEETGQKVLCYEDFSSPIDIGSMLE